MPVAVFDTYVKKSNGDSLHFDILIPEGKYSHEEVLAFGKTYLESLGEGEFVISSKECQFCHIEEPSREVLDRISAKGYYILELGTIPAKLPESPSRKDMILYIRSNFEDLRFENFGNYSIEKLKDIIGSF